MVPTAAANSRPIMVVVSGRPASGKSTLSRLLADRLSCPLVARDEINSGLLQTLTRGSQLPTKDELARLTFDVFGRTLALLVSSGVTFVATAAFQHERWNFLLEPLLSLADVRVVHCAIPPEIARERLIHRYLQARQGDPSVVTEATAMAAREFESLALPVPALTVSTSGGYDPPLDRILAFIRSGSAEG